MRSLETGEQRTVLRNGIEARYVTTGHLVYFDAGALLAVRFDLRALAVSGAPVPVAEAVASSSAIGRTINAAHFAISRAGTLAYVSGGLNVSTTRTMVWVDRAGKEEPLGAEERAYVYPRISPDGRSIALTLADQDRDIWIFDSGRKRLRRLTSDPASERYSIWTPDGKRIAFGSNRDGQAGTWWQAADGSGVPERLAALPLERFGNLIPNTISPDGSWLVATAAGPGARGAGGSVDHETHGRSSTGRVAADGVCGTVRGNITRRPLDGLRGDRAEPSRGVGAAVSGCEQREMARLERWGVAAALVAQREGAVLHRCVRSP